MAKEGGRGGGHTAALQGMIKAAKGGGSDAARTPSFTVRECGHLHSAHSMSVILFSSLFSRIHLHLFLYIRTLKQPALHAVTLQLGIMRGPGDDLFRPPQTSEQSVVDGINKKREKLELYQSESHKMKSLMMNSAGIRSDLATENERPLNPLWVNFPTKCVRRIWSVEEMKLKLEYFSKSDDVMVVRYFQKNCTACNAVDKVFEVLCHQAQTRTPGLKFYEISRDEVPELTKGLVRFPQIKGYSGGQWTDIDFKPPTAFREQLYSAIEKEVQHRKNEGTPVTALQAEEMYFSGAGPAMLQITEENLMSFYCKAQVRLHNYWKQTSLRRSWFFRKFIEPQVDNEVADEWRTRSLFGEKVVHGPQMSHDD